MSLLLPHTTTTVSKAALLQKVTVRPKKADAAASMDTTE
jgi:hypothetical protein